MNESSMYEKSRAASEARDAVTSRPAGSSDTAITVAMRRYLTAEMYHELSDEDEESASEPAPDHR
jgi:hypothetical protein